MRVMIKFFTKIDINYFLIQNNYIIEIYKSIKKI